MLIPPNRGKDGRFRSDYTADRLEDDLDRKLKELKNLKELELRKYTYLRYYYERKLLLKGFIAYYEWGVKRRENMGWKGWIKDLWDTEIWEQATDLQFEYYYKLSRDNTFNCPKCEKPCSRAEVVIHHPHGYNNCYKEIFSLEHTELICKDHEHIPEKIITIHNNYHENEEKL